MNDRLAELLQQEAELIEIPSPRATESLAQGRRMRRTQRIRAGAATLAVVALIASGVAGVLSSGNNEADPVLNPQDYGFWGAWADGRTLYVGGEPMAMEGGVVAIHQTSAGVLARVYVERDSVGTTTFVLVRPDGSQELLPFELGAATRVGTASDQPFLVFSKRRDVDIQLVAYDVDKGEVAAQATVAIPDAGVDGISGDPIYQSPLLVVGPGVVWVVSQVRNAHHAWDLETGAVAKEGPPEWGGSNASDRYTTLDRHTWTVRSRLSGEVVAAGALPHGVRAHEATLSPDGTYLVLTVLDGPPRIVDTSTGDDLFVPPGTGQFSFTPDSRLIAPLEHDNGDWAGLRSCDLRTGDCETKMLTRSTHGLLSDQGFF